MQWLFPILPACEVTEAQLALNKYLLAAYFVPNSITETRDKMMNKTIFILKKSFQALGEVGQNVGNSLMAGNSAIV